MTARIAFSTHYPDRMGDLAGKPTRFPEKIACGIGMSEIDMQRYIMDNNDFGGIATTDSHTTTINHPKTTTIRSNYEYWKSKEGQLIQPFFWAGKPYRSKHVVFCPEVRLEMVWRVKILPTEKLIEIEFEDSSFRNGYSFVGKGQLIPFTQDEGFDHPDHFWMWFNSDFDGAYLELESVEG